MRIHEEDGVLYLQNGEAHFALPNVSGMMSKEDRERALVAAGEAYWAAHLLGQEPTRLAFHVLRYEHHLRRLEGGRKEEV